ncbi:MAG: MFS transporter [candidate division Zixibacteria bacterium]|nr:MFS transporter [candidate division Zixibacteria bacterium]
MGIFDRVKGGTVHYIRDLRRLTPNARRYLMGAFFLGMTSAAFSLLLNLYLKQRGFEEGFIGSVLSAGGIGMTVVAIPGAILLARISLKPVLLISSIFYVICGLTAVYSDSKTMIWGAYFMAGAMTTFPRIGAGPFFMRNSSATERPYLFSLSFGIGVVAGVVGSIVFGELVKYFSVTGGYDLIWAYRLSLTVGILFSIASLIPFSLLSVPNEVPSEDKLDFNRRTLAPMSGLYLRLLLPSFIVGIGAGIIIPFLNLFFNERFGRSADQIGIYFGLVNLTMFIGVMAGPVLVRKIGMVRTMVFTELASIPFMLVLAYCYSLPLVFAAFLIRGALMNMGSPIGNNFAMEMVPKAHQGLLNALLTFSWTSSWMISTQVGGIVIQYYGFTLSLVIAVVLYVFSALLYYYYFHQVERRTPEGIIIQPGYRPVGES